MLAGFLLLGKSVVLKQLPDLEQLRWHNRVVLLFATDSRDTRLAAQRGLLETSIAELAERDIKVFEISGNSAENSALRTKSEVHDEDFAVILIGKDGYSKLHRSKPVAPAELFRLIDSMPMRRNEVQRRH